jgi:hypothetical protein
VGVQRWPVHRVIAHAARPRRVPAAVAEASLMPYQHLLWTEGCAPFGHRVGGRVIHFPAVVCTKSPNTTKAYGSIQLGVVSSVGALVSFAKPRGVVRYWMPVWFRSGGTTADGGGAGLPGPSGPGSPGCGIMDARGGGVGRTSCPLGK